MDSQMRPEEKGHAQAEGLEQAATSANGSRRGRFWTGMHRYLAAEQSHTLRAEKRTENGGQHEHP